MGSPPPAGSKKAVLKFRSVRSIVIAPAKTGNERRRRTAVIFTDQTNSGRRSNSIARQRILITVVMKLIAPKIEEMRRGGERRWQDQQMPLYELNFPKGEGIQFILYQPRFQQMQRIVRELKRGAIVKSSYYLFGGTLYLGRLVLRVPVSFRIRRLSQVLPKRKL